MGARAEPKRQQVRLRGRSYVAFVFCPVVPIVGWLEEIDATLARSPGFFVGKPVVLDLSALDLSQSAIAHLVTSLETRNIRILGIEGVAEANVAAARKPGPFRSIDYFCRRRCDRAGFGQFRRGDLRWRVHPHLRNASRPGDGGRQRQSRRADLLPENRSRTAGHRRLLPDCRTNRPQRARSAGSSLARRRRHENYTVELTSRINRVRRR